MHKLLRLLAGLLLALPAVLPALSTDVENSADERPVLHIGVLDIEKETACCGPRVNFRESTVVDRQRAMPKSSSSIASAPFLEDALAAID